MIQFDIADHADQKFATVLNGKRVSIRLRYNTFLDRWCLDLSVDGAAVLHGRKIVRGVDILAAYDFGVGIIIAGGPAGSTAEPGRNDLHDGTMQLYHATQEELDAAIST